MANWFNSILGKVSGNVAEVDASSQLLVSTNQDPTKAGAVKLYDADNNPLATEENGSLAVSQDQPVFFEQVDGNAVNTNKWIVSASGMTVGQSGGFLTLNNNLSTAANAYAIVTSILNIPFYGDLPVQVRFSGKVAAAAQPNVTFEAGVGSVATNAAPTDGAYVRVTPNGAFQCVTNYGGSETIVTVAGGSPLVGVKVLFGLTLVEDRVMFYVNDILVADVPNPPGLSYPFSAGHQPVFVRVYNGSGSPSVPQTVMIGQVLAVQTSMDQGKPWTHVAAEHGLSAYQSPVTPFAQTPNRANSSAAASLTLSNTVPSLATLGGEWQVAAPVGAVTDFALFGFQVPAPYRLKVFAIRIWAATSGVAIITPATLDWVLGVNGSAASLATADSPPTSWAPRRIPVGSQSFLALAGVGSVAPDITQRFDAPLVVDAGRYFHVILRIPAGAATGSLLYRGGVFVDGLFE